MSFEVRHVGVPRNGVLSEYARSLDAHIKHWYLEKLSVIGVDPPTLPSEQFLPECLPPIEVTDLLSYLVLDTSFYTKQQFKAYKSLEAFNQMVSGFVTAVGGIVISGKYVVAAKVRHSQRMNSLLICIWIITESDGTIISAHCLDCKAGLSETCSHVASVMFYIEAWTRIHGTLACMQVKCTWLLPTYVKEVSNARVADINFKSAKKVKEELHKAIDCIDSNTSASVSVKQQVAGPSILADAPTSSELASFYSKLIGCSTKPVLLSLIVPYAEQFVSKSRSIPAVTDLYNPANLDLEYSDLLRKCLKVKLELSEEEIGIGEKETRKQAKDAAFFQHRPGRLGASVSGSVYHTNLAQPSQSLVKSICYPHLYKLKNKAVKHGCKYEEAAIAAYRNQEEQKHANFKITRCGLSIDKDMPFLHAIPDFLV